jgi:ABC-type ATPase involved in cell division
MAVTKKLYEGTKTICDYSSSNLSKGIYDRVAKTLVVVFKNGSIYEYENVPQNVFSAMNIAESQGKYFNANIARNFKYKKIDKKDVIL